MSPFRPSGNQKYDAGTLLVCGTENIKIDYPYSIILFVLTGELNVSCMDLIDRDIQSGEMFFLPPGLSFKLSSTQPAHILFLQLTEIISLCLHFFPTGILSIKTDTEQILNPIQIVHPIHRWIGSMELYIQDNKVDESLMEIKSMELFYLLKRCYSRDKLNKFFSSIMSEDHKFVLFVLSNYTSVKTAEELAHLSNYSFSGFEKQFRKVFGIAPYRWMMKKKTQKVYQEIYETLKPLKIIADENSFSSMSQLSDFCRKHFGLSPIAIRNKRIDQREL